MTAIREAHPIDDSESRRLDLNVSVEIKISSREAQRRCNIWLSEEVAMSFTAQEQDKPELLLREDGRVIWRCLIQFVAHIGPVGILGYLDVDVTTGDVFHTEKQITQFFELAKWMSETLPPYKPKPLPPELRPPAHLTAALTPTIYD